MNFVLKAKCDLSAYHFTIAINIVLITSANFVLTNFFIRKYWTTYVSAFFRYSSMLLLFCALGWLPVYHHNRPKPKWLPSSTSKTSAILLPASCFLDSDFHVFKNLTGPQLDEIGHPMLKSGEFYFYILNALGLGIGILKNIVHACAERRKRKSHQNYSRIASVLISVYKGFILSSWLSVTVYSWYHILKLKEWVGHSGWIEQESGVNPEDRWKHSWPACAVIRFDDDSHCILGPLLCPGA